MKRTNHLFDVLCQPETIRFAAWRAAKGKRYGEEVQAWFRNLDCHVAELLQAISEVKLILGPYRYFKVYEPKERQICASPFRDQVVHHSLMLVAHDTFEQAQVFDSYASRKGKGVYAALDRAISFHRKYDWYLKLDVRKFFDSIHHEVLKQQLGQKFRESSLLELFEQVIDSYEASPDRGLPIGNLTSQYFANHYLSGLDHFIKENLRCKAYVRYMDDMVLWSDDKEQLKIWQAEIHAFVEGELRCSLKPVQLNSQAAGLSFLGYRILPHQIRLKQESKARFIRKLRKVETKYLSGEWTEAACRRRSVSLYSFIEYADTVKFRKSLDLYKGRTS